MKRLRFSWHQNQARIVLVGLYISPMSEYEVRVTSYHWTEGSRDFIRTTATMNRLLADTEFDSWTNWMRSADE